VRDAAAAPPDVTVVICTRNRRVWLEQCVESVRGQAGVSLEIVVVDDASSDGTLNWLRTVSDHRVGTIHLPVSSERSAARNRGLAEARGQYVMFLDDDDWLWPGALRILATGLETHPEAVAAVGARSVWFTAENYQRRDAHPRIPRVRDVMQELLAGWSAVSGQNLYRTALVRGAGGYDSTVIPCEDRDLWLRLAVVGPVVLRPEIVMTYRLYPGQSRPLHIRQIRERVARKAIRSMPAGKRRQGLLLRRSNALLDLAEDALTEGRFGAGLVAAAQAVAAAPAIYCSPLIGEWVLRRLAGRVARRLFPAKHNSENAKKRPTEGGPYQ
jgi:glycosyltransferase involved in cell wall biosynthesis